MTSSIICGNLMPGNEIPRVRIPGITNAGNNKTRESCSRVSFLSFLSALAYFLRLRFCILQPFGRLAARLLDGLDRNFC